MQEASYYLGFSCFPGIGPKRFKELLSRFDTAEKSWRATPHDLISILGKSLTEQFVRYRGTFSIAAYEKLLEKNHVWYLILQNNTFPEKLKALPTPPFVLYGKGNKELVSGLHTKTALAIVGTRKVTGYGKQVTQMIASELSQAGCVIISGLAFGVDAIAHTTTLDEKGQTIAVLGSGVGICHPSGNQALYDRIVQESGAVISEYPLFEAPSKGSFPSRNRIIAGLSDGVIITEGSSDSGALYTTKEATRLTRFVFAIPGPITSRLSAAPNSLLMQGAHMVTNGNDILRYLNRPAHKPRKLSSIKAESKEEEKIIRVLTVEELPFNEIVKKTGLDTSTIGMTLSLMELRGVITVIEGKYMLKT